jgi:hypothetical protein
MAGIILVAGVLPMPCGNCGGHGEILMLSDSVEKHFLKLIPFI